MSRCSPSIRGASASRSGKNSGRGVAVRAGHVHDLLDRSQEARLERPEERVAPDQPLLRDQQAELREPELIHEVLERHRRRVHRVRGVVHRLGRGRIDAERVERRRDTKGSTTVHCASGGGGRPSNGIAASAVVRSTATGRPPCDRAAAASRDPRPKGLQRVRTAFRHRPCIERPTRIRVSFSTRPVVA